MPNPTVPAIDYSWISGLPDQFAAGRTYQRQNQLRDLLGTEQAQQMLKDQNFGGLAALVSRVDPEFGQKMLAQAATARGQSSIFGTPVWGRDEQTGKEGVGAIGRDGQFHVLDTGSFQPERGVTMGNLGYGQGAFTKGEGVLTNVTPKTGALPESYIPPQGFQPFGPSGGTQPVGPQASPPLSQAVPPGFSGVQPQEISPQAAPAAAAVPPAPPQAAPVAQTGGYMPGTMEARKAAMSVKGRTNLSAVSAQMAKNYEALIRSGGIAVTGSPSRQNLEAKAASNKFVGQPINRLRATPEQTVRDMINQAQPGLLAQMRAATELSARSLDSNIELQFYMSQLGDTSGEGLTNLAAIDAFNRSYGEDPEAVKRSVSPGLYKRVKDVADNLMASRPRSLEALAAIDPTAATRAADLTLTGTEQGRQAVPAQGALQGKIAKGSPEEAEALRQARDAIARGADQNTVLQRLQELGISQ